MCVGSQVGDGVFGKIDVRCVKLVNIGCLFLLSHLLLVLILIFSAYICTGVFQGMGQRDHQSEANHLSTLQPPYEKSRFRKGEDLQGIASGGYGPWIISMTILRKMKPRGGSRLLKSAIRLFSLFFTNMCFKVCDYTK